MFKVNRSRKRYNVLILDTLGVDPLVDVAARTFRTAVGAMRARPLGGHRTQSFYVLTKMLLKA